MDNICKVDKKIYCFWTEGNPITPNRLKGLESMRENLGVSIDFLDKTEIEKRILPEAPLHPAYQYLSAVHKSDYLRCYFMHHFGGGYADIKLYSPKNNWNLCFSDINTNPSLDIIGIKEIMGGSPIKEFNTIEIIDNLLSVNAFIVRPHSFFSWRWYNELTKVLDTRYDALRKNPATHPYSGTKAAPNDGYPLRWAELLAEIFHRILSDMWIPFHYKISNKLNSGRIRDIPYR